MDSLSTEKNNRKQNTRPSSLVFSLKFAISIQCSTSYKSNLLTDLTEFCSENSANYVLSETTYYCHTIFFYINLENFTFNSLLQVQDKYALIYHLVLLTVLCFQDAMPCYTTESIQANPHAETKSAASAQYPTCTKMALLLVFLPHHFQAHNLLYRPVSKNFHV